MEGKPIVLVGLMGAGKTSIGRALSRRMKMPFIDLDQEIESIAGCSVIDIFRTYGEPEFRRIEQLVFARILDTAPTRKVISTGEGAFITPSVRELALARAVTVWLRADLKLLEKRTGYRATRPQLLEGQPAEILSRLMAERYPIYAMADIVIDTADEPRSITTAKVEKAIVDMAA